MQDPNNPYGQVNNGTGDEPQHIPVRQVPPQPIQSPPYNPSPMAPVPGPAPQPQPVAPPFQPDITPESSAPPVSPYTVPPVVPRPQTAPQSHSKPRFTNKIKVIAGVAVLLVILGALVAVDLKPKSSKKATGSNASQIARSTYQDSASGLLISYPASWKFSTANTAADGPGKTISLSPHDISSSPTTVRQQYLDDPQLTFYIYDSKPTPKGTSVLTAAATKLTDLYIVAGANDYIVKSSLATNGETIMLSSCPDKYCVLQVNSKYIVPELTTYSTAAGATGHGTINTTSADYQTAIRIWQSLRY